MRSMFRRLKEKTAYILVLRALDSFKLDGKM
jgi:hypothetical protein